jgi:hypothetical protein
MRFPEIDFSLHTHQEFSLFQARQILENASREQLIETCLSLLEQKFRTENVVKSLAHQIIKEAMG